MIYTDRTPTQTGKPAPKDQKGPPPAKETPPYRFDDWALI